FSSSRIRGLVYCFSFFFFQAEDGIRDRNVTGVQTCALPICLSVHKNTTDVAARSLTGAAAPSLPQLHRQAARPPHSPQGLRFPQIGRASCRERVWGAVGAERE